jgi:transposase InsO family protein
MSTLRWLNLLFRDDANVEAIYQYLKNGTRPAANRKKLTQEVLDRFELEGDNIVYKDEQLMYIPAESVQHVLQDEYNNLSVSAGLGADSLYKVIGDTYYGVSRTQIRDFLSKQPAHQLTRSYKKVVNKPVLAQQANERWMIDLVELERFSRYNSGNRYLLNVIDVFSRYLWSIPLKRKEAVLVRDALEQIAQENGYPRVLQSDLGSEFRGEVDTWSEQHNIKRAKSRSYSPQSQGLLESVNSVLRKKIADALIRNQTRRYIDYLDACVQSWNGSTHGQQKHPPIYLYHSSEDDIPEEQREAIEKYEERARKAVAKNKVKELEVGQLVRVKITAVSTAARKEVKTYKTTKNIVVKWTPELYRVASIIKPDGGDIDKGLQKLQYTVKDMEGRFLHTERRQTDAQGLERRSARFFASELLPVNSKEIEGLDLPAGLTDKLNIGLGEQTRVEPPPRQRAPPRQRREQAPAEAAPPRRSVRENRGRNRQLDIYEMT